MTATRTKIRAGQSQNQSIMLRPFKEQRTFGNNLLLASSTALAAGMTNLAGMMACFSFTSNVTGHSAAFAQHLLKGSWFEMLTALSWLFLFFAGAFTAHFLIRSFEYSGSWRAHALPLVLEIGLMLFVACYGFVNRNNTEIQTEVIAGVLLFCMGLQNGLVSTISGGSIKTSHLTGLFTDLGSEAAEWLHPGTGRPAVLKEKLKLRFTILLSYLLGALAGGWLFLHFSFAAFFGIAIVLLFIFSYDIIKAYFLNNTLP
jgi:uncharacterized membrane protein YoaK (UPF0700 family)